MRARRAARHTGRRAARRTSRRKTRRAGAGLLGAAAVGGAGYYAGKKISESRQSEADQDQQIADLQDQAAYQQAAASAPPPPAPAPAAAASTTSEGSDTAAQLQQLSQLHDSGGLTDDEFAAAKQKVLASG